MFIVCPDHTAGKWWKQTQALWFQSLGLQQIDASEFSILLCNYCLILSKSILISDCYTLKLVVPHSVRKGFKLYCKAIDKCQPEEEESHFHYQGLNIKYVIYLNFSTNTLWGTSLALKRCNENFRNMKILINM